MDQRLEQVWQDCLEVIRDNIDRQSFETWFEPLEPARLEDFPDRSDLTIRLPSRFYYEWLEEHYYDLVRKTIRKVAGPATRLVYEIVIRRDNDDPGDTIRLPASPLQQSTPTTSRSPGPPGAADEDPRLRFGSGIDEDSLFPVGAPPTQPLSIPSVLTSTVDTQLNPSYTFDRFIEGDCNRLARSASVAIAERPGKTSFNPFMIYGGVGLGKTHLIQAIGNYAVLNNTARRVLYVSSERFTSEFVHAIQHNRVNEFTTFYRSLDVLVIDDAQFFSGKEKTQEEFFHIFNALHQAGRQIVLSADRPPRDIQGIEERLLSRFQWGLSADMQAPDLETRTAILRRKAEDDGIAVDDEVIEFIAHNIKSNIRELEGALIRLLAYSTLNSCEISLPLAKEVLRDLVKDARVTLTIDELQSVVCEYFGIPVDLVCAKTRKREVVRARQIAMYFCKELTQHSLKTIGLHFGGRDHSTVIHANQAVLDQIETDPQFRDEIDEIRHKIELRSR
jgi:chromosomal replication initiator protein